ncbi:hypothetical protein QC762_606280 [Podospora pseudocomata]|uniref:Uncharacterized protein n=1 Tax=Podospora pseudocomata TaxID=2093779 RepID=A0ABR0G829_9PEZI|nr:hypothetical protein QC762_606280 [Podospora pseudocomata]
MARQQTVVLACAKCGCANTMTSTLFLTKPRRRRKKIVPLRNIRRIRSEDIIHHSMASSSYSQPQDPDQQKTLTTKASNESLAAASTVVPDSEAPTTGKQPQAPTRYLYYEKVGEPDPNYVPKPPSKLAKFMAKFQSPMVKATEAKRQAEIDEEKRTGIKVYTPAGAPMGSGQHIGNALS